MAKPLSSTWASNVPSHGHTRLPHLWPFLSVHPRNKKTSFQNTHTSGGVWKISRVPAGKVAPTWPLLIGVGEKLSGVADRAWKDGKVTQSHSQR